jgi:hypothetical protein
MRNRITTSLNEYRPVVLLFVMAIVAGIGGITGTSRLLSDAFERTPEGQAILAINVEVSASLHAVTFGYLVVVIQQQRDRAAMAVAEQAEAERLAQATDRKMRRIALEIAELARTHERLVANPLAETRFIWRRAAWYAAERHLAEYLTEPGLFYALENFYMAADALRDADHDRALHLWDKGWRGRAKARKIVTRHLDNFTEAYAKVVEALTAAGYPTPA